MGGRALAEEGLHPAAPALVHHDHLHDLLTLDECFRAELSGLEGAEQGGGRGQSQRHRLNAGRAQLVVEEEDLPLELGQFLFVRLVGVGDLEQTTAAHQTSVRHSEDLQGPSYRDGEDGCEIKHDAGKTGQTVQTAQTLKERRIPLTVLRPRMDCSTRLTMKPEPVGQRSWDVSELTVSPKGLDESLHFLGLSLDTDVSLELSEGFVQLHAGEIHLIHNTTNKRRTERKGKRDIGFRYRASL
ncbi:hypothetical protein EYF80_009663 [Liparis tanakae]|uniref:Uncharacterized protein n=1 Tax=Liparis tanakae TaxID=230148 RepID=A0A4Z2IR49_9TELE|nr:hypothetical protein EYF80_009663 [Liparis tanakae]